MEGRLVRSLMEKVELSSALGGDERGEAAAVSNSTAALIAVSEQKGNLRIGIHYLFLQRD